MGRPSRNRKLQRRLVLELWGHDDTIVTSQDLMRSKIDIEQSGLALDLFFLVLLKSNKEIDSKNFTDFPALEFDAHELFPGGSDLGGKDYAEIKAASKMCQKAIIETIKYHPKTGRETGYRYEGIFDYIDYDKGKITAKIKNSMAPHLVYFEKHTKQYWLELSALSSFYSRRLYQQLMTWIKPNGFWETPIDVLYDMLSFPVKLQNNFSHLKLALDKAKKDIKENTAITFEINPKKTGRKVTDIRFTISHKQNTLPSKPDPETQAKNKRNNAKASSKKCRETKELIDGYFCTDYRNGNLKCEVCYMDGVRPAPKEFPMLSYIENKAAAT